jgi:hypothetical protein
MDYRGYEIIDFRNYFIICYKGQSVCSVDTVSEAKREIDDYENARTNHNAHCEWCGETFYVRNAISAPYCYCPFCGKIGTFSQKKQQI